VQRAFTPAKTTGAEDDTGQGTAPTDRANRCPGFWSLTSLQERSVAKENPNHSQPDELPENERTGNEPNPSGQQPRRPGDHPNAPPTDPGAGPRG